ncbi:MAG: Gfo/Idh/MocA family oxidoreductase [Pirellulales bacterium]|nr:Gfo/Idh/MocA family oxidoreductase [Pirellulales bacterium]
MSHTTTRRRFLQHSVAGAAASAAVPYIFTSTGYAADGEKLTTAAIGVGGRGRGIGNQLRGRSNMVAVCDVDENHANRFGGGKLKTYKDYRKLLEDKSIQAVTVGTPDHWHTPIVLAALNSGKDVYCEKPLTLTIDEGKLLAKAVKDNKRVMQVGTQQRTEYGRNFLRAVVFARSGRLGKLKTATASIGSSPNSDSFATSDPPPNLDWDFWLGQAPLVDYCRQRCHGSFRWWYEYSGGKMTDWGAHHVDIAQWALGHENDGPTTIENAAEPVHPKAADKNGFNTAITFKVKCTYDDGIDLFVQHGPGNGILIEGEKGRIFVNRGGLKGKPVEDLKQDKDGWAKLEEEVVALFDGRQPKEHMDNFLDAVKDRKQPMSDVFTHHRAMTTCHLCNIAVRTGKKINWDPAKELSDDSEVNEKWVKREQRDKYAFGYSA